MAPKETPTDLADQAANKLQDVADKAEEVITAAGEQMRNAADTASEVAGHVKSAVDKSITEQPMALLAVAAAVGFIIGALWKS